MLRTQGFEGKKGRKRMLKAWLVLIMDQVCSD